MPDANDGFQAAMQRGDVARREDRPDAGRSAFADAARAVRGADRPADLALALRRQAQIERDLGALAEALAFQAEAVALYRRGDDSRPLAHALRHLAEILDEAGRPKDAAAPMAEMLDLYRQAEDVDALDMANATRSAAALAEQLGELEHARRLWTEAHDRYGGLDARFLELTGEAVNPGVREAARRLARLSP